MPTELRNRLVKTKKVLLNDRANPDLTHPPVETETKRHAEKPHCSVNGLFAVQV